MFTIIATLLHHWQTLAFVLPIAWTIAMCFVAEALGVPQRPPTHVVPYDWTKEGI